MITTWKSTWGVFAASTVIITFISFTSGMTLPDMLSIYIPSEGELSKKEMQTAFDVGSEFYNQEYYDKAIAEFLKINEHSSRYSDAQVKLHDSENMYRQQLFDKADAYVEKNQFESAINTLDYGKNILGDSDPTLIVKISSCIKLYYEFFDLQVEELSANNNYLEALNILNQMKQIFVDKDYVAFISQKESNINERYTSEIKKAHTEVVFSEIKTYVENDDILGAIEYLRSERDAVVDPKTADDQLQDLYSAYREQVLILAKNAFQDIGYKEAVDILKDSISIIGNDQVIEDTIEDYLEYAPIRLWQLEYFTKSAGPSESAEVIKDNFEGLHSNVIYSDFGIVPSDADIYKDFYLDGKYSRLTGTIFRTFKNRGASDNPYITIYCDGSMVYKESIPMGGKPVSFSVDLTGVEVLYIDIDTSGSSLNGNYLVGGVSNLLIYKKTI